MRLVPKRETRVQYRYDLREEGAAHADFKWYGGTVTRADMNTLGMTVEFDSGLRVPGVSVHDPNLVYCTGDFRCWPECEHECAHRGADIGSRLDLCAECVDLFDERFPAQPTVPHQPDEPSLHVPRQCRAITNSCKKCCENPCHSYKCGTNVFGNCPSAPKTTGDPCSLCAPQTGCEGCGFKTFSKTKCKTCCPCGKDWRGRCESCNKLLAAGSADVAVDATAFGPYPALVCHGSHALARTPPRHGSLAAVPACARARDDTRRRVTTRCARTGVGPTIALGAGAGVLLTLAVIGVRRMTQRHGT